MVLMFIKMNMNHKMTKLNLSMLKWLAKKLIFQILKLNGNNIKKRNLFKEFIQTKYNNI